MICLARGGGSKYFVAEGIEGLRRAMGHCIIILDVYVEVGDCGREEKKRVQAG